MQGVIFDLDGTLIDSMWIWEKIDLEVLAKFGKVPTDSYYEDTCKLNYSQCIRYIKDKYEINLSYDELDKLLQEMAYEEYSNIKSLKPGAKELILELKRRGVKIGLATSCLRVLSEKVLSNCGVLNFFDVLVYSDELNKNKTEPDIYLETASLMGIAPKDIVVFEDFSIAAASAKKAGAKVVGVYDTYNHDQKDVMIGLCDVYIENFCDFLLKKSLF